MPCGSVGTKWGLNSEELWVWLNFLKLQLIKEKSVYWRLVPELNKSRASAMSLWVLTLSQSCLLPVCLWDCKFVSAPKFMYGCFSNLFLWCFSMIKISIWCNIFVSDLFLGVVIQYQDLCMIITFVDMVLLEFPFTSYFENCSQQPLYVL